MTSAEARAFGRSAFQQGGFAQAEPVFREILQAEPNDAEALSFLAAACLGQGKTGEAVALYQRLLSLAPASAEAYCNLGVAYAMQGLNDEAAANYRRALQLKPDYPEAYRNLGVALGDEVPLAATLALSHLFLFPTRESSLSRHDGFRAQR